MSSFDISALPPSLVREPVEQESTDNNQLGQEAFLKLMLAQLENQDPLQPLENGEFLGQIAQFSTVTGIQELQNIMTGLSGSLSSDRSLRAASLLDRAVLVETAEADLDSDSGLSGAIELEQSADNVRVELLTPGGELVGRVDLGPSGAGLNSFRFNGVGAGGELLPEGRYRIRATATAGGETLALQSLVSQQVAGVRITPESTDLTLDLAGGGSVSLDDVRRID